MSFIMCLGVILFLVWLISLKLAERIGNLTIKYIIKPIKNMLKGDK